jgi:1-pyrroline-5-carboxylate dehydrogenase
VRDGSVFMSAVIDAKSFARNKSYIDFAKTGADGAKVIFGDNCDDSKGYFIQPTLIQVTDINSKLLKEVCFDIYIYVSLLI